MLERLDAHFHFDFLPEGARAAFLAECTARGIGLVAQTLTPSEFVSVFGPRRLPPISEGGARALPRFSGSALPSLGLHPWRIPEVDLDVELELFASCLSRTRFIGEVGLDYSPRRLEAAPKELQREVFASLLAALVEASSAAASSASRPFVLSIHTVRSAGDALDLLEGAGSALVPVFHRFNGTSDELTRILGAGGLLSANPAMLESKRGRAYLRRVPADRLLLESDLPAAAQTDGPSTPSRLEALGRAAAEELDGLLSATLAGLAELRGGKDANGLAETIARTAEGVYSA